MYAPPGIPNPATIKDNRDYAVKGQTLRFILEQCIKVAGLNGHGVSNTPSGITIAQRGSRRRPRRQQPQSTALFGKAVASWTSGNTIVLTPCNSLTDGTATGSPTVTCYIELPIGSSPVGILVATDDILAYFPLPDDGTGIPKGLLTNLRKDTTTTCP